MPVWHASIAKLGPRRFQTLRIDELPDSVVAAMARIALELLDGVGTGETFVKYGEVAIHQRRRLADDELARLTPEWLAIPAVDMG